MTVTAPERLQSLPAYQPVSTSDALARAEQYGVDGLYGAGDDWHQALKDTAARYAAEGAMTRLERAGVTGNPHEQDPTPHPPYPMPAPDKDPDTPTAA